MRPPSERVHTHGASTRGSGRPYPRPVAAPDDTPASSQNAATSRGGRFVRAALALLGETGRTDFTVQQVVTRARASYRDFYQHFATKDELLLTLSGDIVARFTAGWRAEVAPLDTAAALRLLIDRVGAQPASEVEGGINRGLSLYYEHLAQSRPHDVADLLAPLHELVHDILRRGVEARAVSPTMNTDGAATIVMQMILGIPRTQVFSVQTTGAPVDGALLHEMILGGILSKCPQQRQQG